MIFQQDIVKWSETVSAGSPDDLSPSDINIDHVRQVPKPAVLATSTSRKRKRERVRLSQHPSPPCSMSDDIGALGGTSQRVSISRINVTNLNRAQRLPWGARRTQPATPSTVSSVSNLTDAEFDNVTPTKRRKTSPAKELTRMRFEYLVDQVSFGDGRLCCPDSLRELVERLEDDCRGIAIMTQAYHDELVQYTKANPDEREKLRRLRDRQFVIDVTGRRERLGTLPPCSQLIRIMRNALRCDVEVDYEAEWNAAVHRPILEAAINGARRYDQVSFDVRAIASARIDDSYAPASTAGQKHQKCVDLCIVLQAHNDDDIVAIGKAADQDQSESINHFSHNPLRRLPLILSIETKPHGGDNVNAVYQLSTWLAAHWARLEGLAKVKEAQCAAAAEIAAEAQQRDALVQAQIEEAQEQEQEAGHSGCGADSHFLPGLLVFGHDWLFVAATQGEQGIVMWRRVHIGSTNTLLGIIQIITSLQRLIEWAAEQHWPWLRELLN